MDELSPEARQALAALREDLPADALRARMRERVLAASVAATLGTLAAGSAKAASISSVPAASVGSGAVGGGVASMAVTKLVVILASVGSVAVGATVLQRVERARSEKHEVSLSTPAVAVAKAALSRPALERAGEAPMVSSLALPPTIEAKPSQEVPTPKPSIRSVASPHRRVERALAPARTEDAAAAFRTRRSDQTAIPGEDLPASVLSAESALLLKALTALEAGQTCRVLALLDQHEREWGPTARLALERENMRKRLLPSESDAPPLTCNAQKGTLP
jgi:hypothetical protein